MKDEYRIIEKVMGDGQTLFTIDQQHSLFGIKYWVTIKNVYLDAPRKFYSFREAVEWIDDRRMAQLAEIEVDRFIHKI